MVSPLWNGGFSPIRLLPRGSDLLRSIDLSLSRRERGRLALAIADHVVEVKVWLSRERRDCEVSLGFGYSLRTAVMPRFACEVEGARPGVR